MFAGFVLVFVTEDINMFSCLYMSSQMSLSSVNLETTDLGIPDLNVDALVRQDNASEGFEYVFEHGKYPKTSPS